MNIITRNEYLNIIKTIIDLPLNSVEEYLDCLTKKYSGDNSFFEENLYKDILQVMDGVDNEGDNDLLIGNGDFVIKNGDIQLTGKQNGLHIAMSWLYLRILQKTRSNNTTPSQSINRLHKFNEEFLKEDNNTPEYHKQLEEIKALLKRHKKGKRGRVKRTDVPYNAKLIKDILYIIGAIIGICVAGYQFYKWFVS